MDDVHKQKDEPRDRRRKRQRKKLHLQPVDSTSLPTDPSRTIGKLIAQTALIAESALVRQKAKKVDRSPRSRFGWFL